MRGIIILLLFSFSCAVNAQWVRPNQFPELESVDDTNFEVYSQRYGVNKKASMTTLKKFFDQNIIISGDSMCITRATGTQCVKIPIQAFSQYAQVFSVTSNGTNYTLPTDTISKYDYVLVKYEANASTSNYIVTIPEPSASYNGKTVDVYIHLSPSSGLSYANISSPNSGIQTNDNKTPVDQTNYIAGHGLYRFICTKSINAAGYKWLLINKPGSAIQTKRSTSLTIENQSITLPPSVIEANDELSVYIRSIESPAALFLVTPDSSLIGKTVFLYPTKGTYSNKLNTPSNNLILFSGEGHSTTNTVDLTKPSKATCMYYSGVYYWDFREIYGGSTSSSTEYPHGKYIYLTNDYSLSSDTVSKYDKVFLEFVTQYNNSITLPDPVALSGKEIVVFPVLSTSNSLTIIGSIGKWNAYGSFTSYASVSIDTKTKFVSDGNRWKWYREPTESVSGRKLIGRYSTNSGKAQEITLGSGFSWNGSTLNVGAASGGASGYTLTSLPMSTGGVAVISYAGLSAPTITTNSAGSYTINVPDGTSIFSYTISADTDDCAVDGSIDIKVQWVSLPSNINSSKDNAFIPSVTVTEKITTVNAQQADYAGWQITHPLIASNAVTTRITGINGFSAFIIKGIF